MIKRLQNKYFIGYIKIFAEGGKDLRLWISTTDKKINVIGQWDDHNNGIENITINMTVIIFASNEQTLRSITLETKKPSLIMVNNVSYYYSIKDNLFKKSKI